MIRVSTAPGQRTLAVTREVAAARSLNRLSLRETTACFEAS
jgi:hypothetical protein